ncbi:M90 family metallopeptidase [Pedobacter ureilyticus]|uniref:Zinc-dependent peptidase n=1 Tax=Pedobacter ureilyticus TaxID=1393051 RepID=A0ABW9J6Z3_9SPHI|nr:M90 family metallopeptidase [Pedobacter helvus]
MNLYPYFILLIFFAVALYFIFRKKKVPVVVLSAEDRKLLQNHVAFYAELDNEKKMLFEEKLSRFLGGIKIEGIGTEISPLDRILVGASAVIPILGFKDWEYRNLGTVLLYPDTFNKEFQFAEGDRNIMGMVGDGYMNGQMILSQSALRHGFSKSAGSENTGIHEFVHLIDKSDGATDGIPQYFIKHEYTIPWVRMMHREIQKIEDNKSDINPYAITNEAEFFAVTSEYFFENPERMKDKHPALYDSLSKIFGQQLA